jgi:uncharacterized membrane protein
MERVVSNLLRIGVATSLFVVVFGTAVTFVHHPAYVTSGRDLHRLTGPGADFPHSVPAVIRGIEHHQGRSLVVAGLLLLIATPVLRVAVSIVAFATQRDRTFVIVTSIVLTVLVASFLLGRAGA